MLATLLLCALPLAFGLAAVSDLLTMKIPDAIAIALILLFFPAAVAAGLAGPQVGLALVAALAVFLLGFGLFALNVMGGGDAKLLAASALWYGFTISLFEYLVTVCLAGGALTLAILLMRFAARRVAWLACVLPDSLASAQKVPYAVAIAIGGLWSMGHAPLVVALRAAIS